MLISETITWSSFQVSKACNTDSSLNHLRTIIKIKDASIRFIQTVKSIVFNLQSSKKMHTITFSNNFCK